MLHETAPAKINLFLHVLGRRQDGYHHLESLVSFTDFGDSLTLEPGKPLGLTLSGPFGAGLDADDNLVLKAARAFVANVGKGLLGHFHLEKRLPVASGIGGGSSDAAAALRLLARANDISPGDSRVMDAAKTLGADVPVCLDVTAPRLMHGIGHELGDRLHAFRYPALLVNPGTPVETKAVFTKLGLAPGDRLVPPVAEGGEAAFPMLTATRNDLEAPAIRVAPVISEVMAGLEAAEDALFVRMSGSGATCFSIFETRAAAEAAGQAIATKNPGWWCQPTTIRLPV